LYNQQTYALNVLRYIYSSVFYRYLFPVRFVPDCTGKLCVACAMHTHRSPTGYYFVKQKDTNWGCCEGLGCKPVLSSACCGSEHAEHVEFVGGGWPVRGEVRIWMGMGDEWVTVEVALAAW
jgi:hypothetical protein